MNVEPIELAEQLEAVMAVPLGPGVRVAAVQRLKGGYSRRMWAFDALDASGLASAWILCTDSPDGVVGEDSLPRHREAALLAHAHRAGLPAPAIAAVGAAEQPFGVAWFVMERTVFGRFVGFYDSRLSLLQGQALVAIDKPLDAALTFWRERVLIQLRSEGMTVLLVEQNTERVLKIADDVCVLESGSTVWQGSADAARNDPQLTAAYLGLH